MGTQGDQFDGDADYAEVVPRLASEAKTVAAEAGKQFTIWNGSVLNGKFSSLVVLAAALGAVGYGYMRWKKAFLFSDLMLSKRDTEKAASELTKKLRHAADIIDAKKHLTRKIQKLDDKMLKQYELSQSIMDDVSGVRETITGIHEDLGFLQQTLITSDERLSTLSRKKDIANHALAYLVDFLQGRTGKLPEGFQGLEDIAEILSFGLDRSSSDANLPDNMDTPGQQPMP